MLKNKSKYFILPTICLLLTVSCVLETTDTTQDTTNTSTSPCDLTLTYTGPEEAFEYADLNENTAQCALSSWKDYFTTSEPTEKMVFVSANCGQETDGTVNKPYCTILDALDDAAQIYSNEETPEVYVDPGEYTLGVTLKAKLPILTIKGLCSETTEISPSTEGDPIIDQEDDTTVTFRLQNLTLNAGSAPAIQLTKGTGELYQIVLVQESNNECFDVTGSQSELSGDSVIMTGSATDTESTPSTIDGGTIIPMVGSNDVESCITVSNGGKLILQNFSVSDFEGVGILVTGEDSQISLTNGHISNIRAISETFSFGYGMSVEDEAIATLDTVSLSNNRGTNLLVDNENSSASITNSYIGEAQATSEIMGLGIMAQREATLEVTHSNISYNTDAGIIASSDSSVTVSNSFFYDNAFAGIALLDAQATITANTLSNHLGSSNSGGGFGLFIQSRNSTTDINATVSGNYITENRGVGIYIVENTSTAQMNLSIEDNYIYNNFIYDEDYIPQVYTYGVNGTTNFSENCVESLATNTPAFAFLSSDITMSGNIILGTYNDLVINQSSCDNPSSDAIDLTTQTIPANTVSCLCNSLSTTGAYCYGLNLGPVIDYHFGIEETSIVE